MSERRARSMRTHVVASCIGASLAAVACSPTLAPPAPSPAHGSYDTEHSHLLLAPQADAEALLGRAVQLSDDGGWTIADARAPGCEVSVTHEKARFRAARQIEMHSMTSIAGGYAKFVSIEARFGRAATTDIDIENTEVLRADTRGACGEIVVDKVFVGHGKRSIVAAAMAAGRADVHVGVVSAAPSVDTSAKQSDAIEWKDDQAYGFTFKRNEKIEPLEMRVAIPSIVVEGEDVELRFESKRPAWLVVYYLDSEQKADVLWPSNEEPEPHVRPGAPAILPSARERKHGFKIVASLSKPGERARETLVVYGFADKRDFDALKPAAGAANADGATYAAELTKKLQGVAMSRWSRAVVGYVIEPRKK